MIFPLDALSLFLMNVTLSLLLEGLPHVFYQNPREQIEIFAYNSLKPRHTIYAFCTKSPCPRILKLYKKNLTPTRTSGSICHFATTMGYAPLQKNIMYCNFEEKSKNTLLPKESSKKKNNDESTGGSKFTYWKAVKLDFCLKSSYIFLQKRTHFSSKELKVSYMYIKVSLLLTFGKILKVARKFKNHT